MEPFLVSLLVVAVGEMGDKTQLLALVLAARFQRTLPIALGIFVATVANHTLAGLVGVGLRQAVPTTYLRGLLAASFLAVAVWMLVPERQVERERPLPNRLGVFMFSALAFFMAEMGDKTQIATVVLAARFDNLFAVIAGTTLGILAADVPVILLGRVAAARLPLRALRIAAACLFAILALVTWFA